MLDLDAYFGRIGWSGGRSPTMDVLDGLCLRHTSAVPFENLDILCGQPIKLDLAAIADKIVARRRGGYCFEQNALFQSVLCQLGFRVTPLMARVRLGVGPEVQTPRTHMLLRVDLDEGAFIADVGFGFTPTAALRLEPGHGRRLHLDTYRLLRHGPQWTLELLQGEEFTPAYVFTEEPCLPVDYEVANHFTSTHPSSFFTTGPLVMRHDPEGGVRHILRGREWSVRRGAQIETHTVKSPEDALRILAQHFRLELPPGTLFRGLE